MAFLPWPCRAMAAACLQSHPCRRPAAAELLDCDFFPQSVRSAAFFLAALHPARPTLRQTWDPSDASLSPPANAMSVMDKAPWLLGVAPAVTCMLIKSFAFDSDLEQLPSNYSDAVCYEVVEVY